jgi:hypothetical protein
MRHLTLDEALELLLLYAEKSDTKFDRAACRWLGRLITERPNVTLAETQLAVAALSALPTRPRAAESLRWLVSA